MSSCSSNAVAWNLCQVKDERHPDFDQIQVRTGAGMDRDESERQPASTPTARLAQFLTPELWDSQWSGPNRPPSNEPAANCPRLSAHNASKCLPCDENGERVSRMMKNLLLRLKHFTSDETEDQENRATEYILVNTSIPRFLDNAKFITKIV